MNKHNKRETKSKNYKQAVAREKAGRRMGELGDGN